jgi:hypothetical protein
MKKSKIIGYKAFNKDWTCREFKYEVGKTYTIKGKLELCLNGFHFCRNSCDVLNYYLDINCKYALIEAENVKDDDDKSVCSKITILKEISKNELLQAHKNNIKPNEATTGEYAHSSTTGDYANSSTTGRGAHSSTTGHGAHSSTTGQDAHSSTTGKNSISIAVGIKSKAKAENGFITISNWIKKNGEWVLKEVKSQQVGKKIKGKTIKPNHWYWFKNNKLMEEENK